MRIVQPVLMIRIVSGMKMVKKPAAWLLIKITIEQLQWKN
jgi:hypothetical protein